MVTLEELRIRETIAVSSRDDDLDLYRRIVGGDWPVPANVAELLEAKAFVGRLFERVEHNNGLSGRGEVLLTLDDIATYLRCMWAVDRQHNVALEAEGRYLERFAPSFQHARMYMLIALLALRCIAPVPVPLRWASEVSLYLSSAPA